MQVVVISSYECEVDSRQLHLVHVHQVAVKAA